MSIPQPAVESSSLPSGQSLSPSHSQCRGTQAREPWQLNMSAAQVMVPENHPKKKKNDIEIILSRSTEEDVSFIFPVDEKRSRRMSLTRKKL